MKSFYFNKRTFIGLIIILIGIIFFLDTPLDIIDSDYIFSTYWPVLLIVLGLISLIDRSTRNIFGFILLFVGLFYQVKLLNWFFEGIDIWNIIFPLIIIIVGLWFLFPKQRQSLSIDKLNQAVFFSGADIINTSTDFQGGELSAVFGGIDADLRNTVIKTNEQIVIDAFTAFGGITIKVPENWRVEIHGLPILGGWSNKRDIKMESTDVKQIVTIKCLIICGGIEIK